jgi:hypothetical protein
LVEHHLERGLVLGTGLEGDEILKIRKQREENLGPHVGDLRFAHDEAEPLDSSRPPALP